MTKYRGLAIGAASAAGFFGLQWLGRAAGTTRAERESRLPGDELIEHPMMVTTHAITIDAPREAIWPWLVQMGWHRGQWYTARWVDRLLFPSNDPSADHIVPELQQLSVGDWVPDGPPETGCGFVVDLLAANRHLVLHSTEHLPPQFARRFGAWMDWTWAFTLHRLGPDRTRFVFRSRLCLGPWWLAAGYWTVVIPADFVMARQMLHGVKARAEALTSTPLTDQTRGLDAAWASLGRASRMRRAARVVGAGHHGGRGAGRLDLVGRPTRTLPTGSHVRLAS